MPNLRAQANGTQMSVKRSAGAASIGEFKWISNEGASAECCPEAGEGGGYLGMGPAMCDAEDLAPPFSPDRDVIHIWPPSALPWSYAACTLGRDRANTISMMPMFRTFQPIPLMKAI